MISKELLKILACPQCKGRISLLDEKIVCVECGKKYPIKNGIPIMLVEEEKKWQKIKF